MTIINLFEETGSTIYGWHPQLASNIAMRLNMQCPVSRGSRSRDSQEQLRQTVELLLAQLSTAMRLDQPDLFAEVATNSGVLPAIVRLSMVDRGTVFNRICDALQKHLPRPRGKRAAEYILYALTRMETPERIAA